MHRLSVSLFITAFLLTTATPLPAAAPAAATAPAPAQRGPRLTVADPLHDFGEVRRGEPLRHEFRISNTGNETLAIDEVIPACGCTTTGEWPRSLKPGESGVIPVKVETSEFAGNVIKSVTIKTNDPSQPETVLHLQAAIWTPIKLSSAVIIFPAAANPNEPVTRSITIENQAQDALTLSDVQSDNAHFKAELKTLAAGKRYELVVSTVPPLPEGTQSGRMHVKTSLADMPTLSVQAVATVLPAVQIAPVEIRLPGGKLAQPEKRFAFVLVHRGESPQLSDVTTNVPGAQFTTTPTVNGKQVTIALTFPVGLEIRPGDRFYVRGKTNQPSTPTFEIPIVAAN